MEYSKPKALFLDVGGVLGTNGWGHQSRKKVLDSFGIFAEEGLDERHLAYFELFETGRFTLDEYLQNWIFFRQRLFTSEEFKKKMFAESLPYEEMIALFKKLKQKHQLKIVVISNEGRDLALFRNKKFELDSFVDAFIYSSFLHCRKPNPDIYKYALDISQISPEEAFYIDDRELLIDAASHLGIQGIRHVSYENTVSALAKRGISL